MLGFGRAVGEAIAVAQVIGGLNRPETSTPPPTPGQPLAAQYAGTATSLQKHRSHTLR
jgi:ABC-type phosphate transport system permease subunit